MFELSFVGGHIVFVYFFSQVATVREFVVVDRGYTAVDVEEGTLRAKELSPSDSVSLNKKFCLGNPTIKIKYTGFVFQRAVCDHLHVEVV